MARCSRCAEIEVFLLEVISIFTENKLILISI